MMSRGRSLFVALAGAIVRQVIGLLVAIGLFSLLWQFAPGLAVIALLLFACGQMLLSFRKDSPFNYFTCLLPAGMSLVCYAVQLVAMGDELSGEMLVAAMIGSLAGWVAGCWHRVYFHQGQLFSRRTLGVMLLWVLSFALTQVCALAGEPIYASWGLVAGAFTTAITLGQSASLFRRRLKMQAYSRPLAPAYLSSTICFLMMMLAIAETSFAIDAPRAAARVIANEDVPGFTQQSLPTAEDIRQDRERIAAPRFGDFGDIQVPRPDDTGSAEFRRPTAWANNPDKLGVTVLHFPTGQAAMGYGTFMNNTFKASQEALQSQLKTIPGCGDFALLGARGSTATGVVVVGNWVMMVGAELSPAHLDPPATDLRDQEQRLIPMQFELLEPLMHKGAFRLSAWPYDRDGSSSGNPPPGGGQTPSNPPPSRSPLAQKLDTIIQELRRNRDLSDDDVAAGLAAAIVQLLSGASLATALAAAQAAAAAAGFANSTGTLILSGADAQRWLTGHGFLHNGKPTSYFHAWRNATMSSGSHPQGLGAVAGNWDLGTGEIGDVTIVVNTGTPYRTPLVEDQEPPPASPTVAPAEDDLPLPPVTPPDQPVRDPLKRVPSNRPDGWWPTDDEAQRRTAAEVRPPAPPEQKPLPPAGGMFADTNLNNVKHEMGEIADDLKRQGCFVVNPLQDKSPELVRHGVAMAWNLAWNAVYNNVRSEMPAGMMPPLQGMTCGDYVEKSEKQVADALRRTFPNDPRVKLEVIEMEERSQTRGNQTFTQAMDLKTGRLDDWLDAWNDANHTLFRVTMPDGKQYSIDFWDHARGDGPVMQPWAQAEEKWRRGINSVDQSEFVVCEPREVRL